MQLDKYTKALLTVAVLFLGVNVANANEVFSCKVVSEANLRSDSAYGRALYGDSAHERSWMSKEPTKVLIIEQNKQITFGGDVYKNLGGSYNQFYENRYWGLIEVYEKRKSDVTLFTTRSNGFNSQMSNHLEVKLYHCNK